MFSLPPLWLTNSSVVLTSVCSGLQGTPWKTVVSTELLRINFTGVPEQHYYTSLLLKARAVRQCSLHSCAGYQPRTGHVPCSLAAAHAVWTCSGHSKSPNLRQLEGCVHLLSASLPWLSEEFLAAHDSHLPKVHQRTLTALMRRRQSWCSSLQTGRQHHA